MAIGNDALKQANKDRGLFERLSMLIPGYRGYKQRNQRRDVDEQVRAEVCRSLDQTKTILADIQRTVISIDVKVAKDGERLRTKTDTYIQSIRSMESGYSALWDTMKTEKEDLEEVMVWDERLLTSAAELKRLAENFLDKAVTEDLTGAKDFVRSIERYLDSITDELAERAKILIGLSANGDAGDEKIRKLKNKLR